MSNDYYSPNSSTYLSGTWTVSVHVGGKRSTLGISSYPFALNLKPWSFCGSFSNHFMLKVKDLPETLDPKLRGSLFFREAEI